MLCDERSEPLSQKRKYSFDIVLIIFIDVVKKNEPLSEEWNYSLNVSLLRVKLQSFEGI